MDRQTRAIGSYVKIVQQKPLPQIIIIIYTMQEVCIIPVYTWCIPYIYNMYYGSYLLYTSVYTSVYHIFCMMILCYTNTGITVFLINSKYIWTD